MLCCVEEEAGFIGMHSCRVQVLYMDCCRMVRCLGDEGPLNGGSVLLGYLAVRRGVHLDPVGM